MAREQIDEALSRMVHKVRSLGDREVSARAVGELVMEELRHLDEVAYVRFASVYRQFEDVEAFHEEIQRLRSTRARPEAASRGRKREGGRDASREQLPLLPETGSAPADGRAALAARTDAPSGKRSAASGIITPPREFLFSPTLTASRCSVP